MKQLKTWGVKILLKNSSVPKLSIEQTKRYMGWPKKRSKGNWWKKEAKSLSDI